MRLLKLSGILKKDTPKEKWSSLWHKKELIESGFGLLDQEIMAEQASTYPVVRTKES